MVSTILEIRDLVDSFEGVQNSLVDDVKKNNFFSTGAVQLFKIVQASDNGLSGAAVSNLLVTTSNLGEASVRNTGGSISNLFNTYYSEKPFISIADRQFDYNINPNLLRRSKFKNLLGIGVVCYSEASYKTALFEKEFYDGVFEIFYSMEDCLNWSRSLLKKYNQ